MKTLTTLLCLITIAAASPGLHEEPRDTLSGDTHTLQIQIRLKDLPQLKSAVPFEFGKWRVWRVAQLSVFGDNTPQDWWATVRLDMVILPKDENTSR